MAEPVNWSVPLQVSVTVGAPQLITRPPTAVGYATIRPISRLAIAAPEAAVQFDPGSLTATGFDWKAALSLALASKLSYEDAASVSNTAISMWGLQTCDFVEADETQCFVASTANAVLVAFRGTESLGDWLGNLNLFSTTRSYGAVHRGFLGAFQVVDAQLRAKLAALSGRPVLITGHSLGGALATVAAAEWQGQVPISAIYTYGQPAVGKGTFPAFMTTHYAGKFFRFVNDDDIVPRVPPTYRHVGRLIHFDADGELEDVTESAIHDVVSQVAPRLAASPAEPRMLTEIEFDQMRARLLLERARARASGLESVQTPVLEGLLPSISDHNIDLYIEKIAAFT